MKPVFAFFKSHSYEILVTTLVLSLGIVSRQLRQAESQTVAVPRADAAIASPIPTTSTAPAPTATPEPIRTWLRPVSGGLLTAHSDSEPQWNADMECWQVHTGVDLSADEGEDVFAAADGTVTAVCRDPLLGLTVTLDHGDGYESVYAALSAAHCDVGDRLAAGESVGTAGNSADSEALLGCHLHFELLSDGLPVKPVFQ